MSKKKPDFTWSDYADIIYSNIFHELWSDTSVELDKEKHKVPDNIKNEIKGTWKDSDKK